MRTNKNNILLLAAILLFAFAYLVNDPWGQFKPSPDKSKPLLSLALSDLDSISVSSHGSLLYDLKNENGLWYIVQGEKKFLADNSLVHNAFEPILAIKRFQSVGSGDKLAQKFSLTDTGFKIIFADGKKVQTLYLAQGQERNILLKLDSEKEIYAANSQLLYDVEKNFDYFRDKSILPLAKENIDSLQILKPQTSAVAAEVTHKNENWFLNVEGKEEKCNSTFDDSLQSFLKIKGDAFLSSAQVADFVPLVKLVFTGKSKDIYPLEIYFQPDNKKDGFYFYALKTNSQEWLQIGKDALDRFLLLTVQDAGKNFLRAAWQQALQEAWTKTP